MDYINLIYIPLGAISAYFSIILLFSFISARSKRSIVHDQPDWGITQEHKVPIKDKFLDCWVVYPDIIKDKIGDGLYRDNPAVIITHGWGRSKERMVSRGRIWKDMGYTVILFSARNHGKSANERFGMTIYKFTEDITAIINWWNQSVILHGHSIGAGASIIVSTKNPKVQAVVADAPPRAIPLDLESFYRAFLKWTTFIFFPGFRILLKIIFRNLEKRDYSPIHAAEFLNKPALIQYGKLDKVFSYSFADSFKKNKSDSMIIVYDEAGHSNLTKQIDYKHNLESFVNEFSLYKNSSNKN